MQISTRAILPGMKKRSIGKMFGLFIVTLGFYRLYWLAKTRVELQEKTKLKIPSIWILLLPYILVVISVGMIITSGFNSASSTQYNDTRSTLCPGRFDDGFEYDSACSQTVNEEEMDTVGVIGLILMYVSLLVIFPLMGWWYWKYAQAVEKVTHEKLSFPVTMLIMLAVPDIFDMLIIQDSFNKQKS